MASTVTYLWLSRFFLFYHLLLLLDLTGGFSIRQENKYVYIACYKPALTLCSLTCDKERAVRKGRDIRQTLANLSFPENLKDDLHIVGRLDRDSEGLLLLTNDGQFTARVLSEDCHKTYWALIKGKKNRRDEQEVYYPPSDISLREMRKGGLEIRGAKTRPPISVNLMNDQHSITKILPKPTLGMDRGTTSNSSTWLEVILNEGRNRQVRKITAYSGHKTIRLCRTAIGKFRLQHHQDLLVPGKWKFIQKEDVI